MNGCLTNLLKPLASKQDYVEALKIAIWHTHGCRAAHLKTEHVHETFNDKTVWNGDVEVFNLIQHPKAKRAYAWAHLECERDHKWRFVVLLELPPVKDAKTAVQASIMAESETGQS